MASWDHSRTRLRPTKDSRARDIVDLIDVLGTLIATRLIRPRRSDKEPIMSWQDIFNDLDKAKAAIKDQIQRVLQEVDKAKSDPYNAKSHLSQASIEVQGVNKVCMEHALVVSVRHSDVIIATSSALLDAMTKETEKQMIAAADAAVADLRAMMPR